MARWIATLWGLGGVLALLAHAISRLAPKAVEALAGPLEGHHYGFVAVWVVFMAVVEGYRGFQLRFSPMMVARAHHLAEHPRPVWLLLAPLFCMGFFHGTWRRLRVTWGLTTIIAALAFALQQTPQPWRGLVDMGVVVGLSWGCASIVLLGIQAARKGPPGDPEFPVV